MLAHPSMPMASGWEVLEMRACPEYLEAMHTLKLSEGGIPDMAKLSESIRDQQKATESAISSVLEFVKSERRA